MQKRSENESSNRTKSIRHREKMGFCYSFLTVVLIFCLLQIGYGAILNITKIISYQGKMITLENLLKQTKLRNQDLQYERKMITSDNSLEGIARNNLKMAKEDEVLIIINKKVEAPKKKNSLLDKLSEFSLKKDTKNKTSTQKPQRPYIPETMEEE